MPRADAHRRRSASTHSRAFTSDAMFANHACGPAQPSPVQPSPAQPSPAQPAPAQPSPAHSSPAHSSPAQPSPAQAPPSPAQRRRRPVQCSPSARQHSGSLHLVCHACVACRLTGAEVTALSPDTRALHRTPRARCIARHARVASHATRALHRTPRAACRSVRRPYLQLLVLRDARERHLTREVLRHLLHPRLRLAECARDRDAGGQRGGWGETVGPPVPHLRLAAVPHRRLLVEERAELVLQHVLELGRLQQQLRAA
jgi:hypothetical protein